MFQKQSLRASGELHTLREHVQLLITTENMCNHWLKKDHSWQPCFLSKQRLVASYLWFIVWDARQYARYWVDIGLEYLLTGRIQPAEKQKKRWLKWIRLSGGARFNGDSLTLSPVIMLVPCLRCGVLFCLAVILSLLLSCRCVDSHNAFNGDNYQWFTAERVCHILQQGTNALRMLPSAVHLPGPTVDSPVTVSTDHWPLPSILLLAHCRSQGTYMGICKVN